MGHITVLLPNSKEYCRAYVQNDEESDRLFNQVVTSTEALYLANDLPYHNLDHITSMLCRMHDWWDEAHMTPEQKAVLELAILFHDVVYKPGATNNEDASSDFARTMLKDLPIAGSVAKLIEVTKYGHDCENSDLLGKFLIDLDLWELGTPKYFENAMKIRQEFGHVSDTDFLVGRGRFLTAYYDPEKELFKTKYGLAIQEMARSNMRLELEAIADRGINWYYEQYCTQLVIREKVHITMGGSEHSLAVPINVDENNGNRFTADIPFEAVHAFEDATGFTDWSRSAT